MVRFDYLECSLSITSPDYIKFKMENSELVKIEFAPGDKINNRKYVIFSLKSRLEYITTHKILFTRKIILQKIMCML